MEVVCIYLLVFAGFAAVFVVMRRRRWQALDEELKSEVKVEGKVKERFDSLFKWASDTDAIAAGVVTGYDVFHALSMRDYRVLEAIDFSSKVDLSPFNHLGNYVHDHFFAGDAPRSLAI